jgi:D-glycero-alpha-D-manno-heptose-7-phosphate kinase
MIISRTPYRISLFGGGTDYPGWYLKHGGAVLSTTIDKYCYIMSRYLPPFFDHRYAVRYSRIETVNSIDEIEHPSVRETLRFLGITRGVEINHDGDLPARSGMGSSSSFTVGLLNALLALQGRMQPTKQLALDALHIEQNLIRETVGSQDQVAAAYGGLNHISFLESGDFSVRPITILPSRKQLLEDHLMLFYTGIMRTASNVAASYVTRLDDKRRQLRLMQTLVDEAISVLCSDEPIQRVGELLHEAWLAKRSLSPLVSGAEVDEMYQAALDAGAVGGKITGAGGGGFLLLFAPPEAKPKLLERLDKLIHVPFRFDSSGSQIVVADTEPDYTSAERRRRSQPNAVFRELAAALDAPATPPN